MNLRPPNQQPAETYPLRSATAENRTGDAGSVTCAVPLGHVAN